MGVGERSQRHRLALRRVNLQTDEIMHTQVFDEKGLTLNVDS